MTVVVAPVPLAPSASYVPVRLYAALGLRQIPALDGIRGVGIVMVLANHFGWYGVPAAYAVVSFFVLSGFLITWLLLKEHEESGRIGLRNFYIRRSLRIFPAYYLYWIVLVVALLMTGREVPWAHALSALVYVSNYYNAINGDPNTGFSHIWSLATEEQFYLLWPAAFIFLASRPSRMAIRLALVIALVWVYRALLVYRYDVDQAYLYASFDTRFDALLVGCLIAVMLHRRLAQRLFHWITAHPALALLPLLAMTLIVIDLPFDIPRRRDVIGFALAPPLLGIFIIQMVGMQRSRWWSWLEHPIVRFLGRISYPLYLYQQITLHMVRGRMEAWPVWIQFLAACAVTIVVASMSFYIVERPLLRMKSRFGPATTPRAPASGVEMPAGFGGSPVLSGGMS